MEAGDSMKYWGTKYGISDILIPVYDWTYSGNECMSKEKTLN